ncbi:hypothetical protein L2E82_13732 [Cichorium intybus]|uniref:Uncharacterized protein n=1 Tax=Cichorium intybus TaxID=13427 RepID=A0ACB9EZB1_CICIN|nr:hypothetical protein L2E82_13732 [Cichorium intybus]
MERCCYLKNEYNYHTYSSSSLYWLLDDPSLIGIVIFAAVLGGISARGMLTFLSGKFSSACVAALLTDAYCAQDDPNPVFMKRNYTYIDLIGGDLILSEPDPLIPSLLEEELPPNAAVDSGGAVGNGDEQSERGVEELRSGFKQ